MLMIKITTENKDQKHLQRNDETKILEHLKLS